MSVIEFVVDHKWALIGYAIIFTLIYINRKKFQVDSKVIFLHRTKWGIKTIDKFATKYTKFVKFLGYIAIVLGVAGMLLISFLFIQGIYDLVFKPDAPPVVSPVIPGVCLPGNPICVPFEYGILALFFVILIHEFGHGIVARAHGIKIKSTGYGLMLFLPIAFVEPDEKQVMKGKASVQHSIFAAGPFMNFLLAIFAVLLLGYIINPAYASISTDSGIFFGGIQKNSPAKEFGLERNTVYTHLNGVRINNTDDLYIQLKYHKPYDILTFTDVSGKDVSVKTVENPNNASIPYIGVLRMETEFTPKDPKNTIVFYILKFFKNLFFWIYVLSLGIGIVNLLPVGPIDGGRMVHRASIDWFGKKRGIKIWTRISIFFIVILIILLITPILKSIIKF